jgi:hypothetical protein
MKKLPEHLGTITIFASGNIAEVKNVNNDEPARNSSR